MIFVGIGALIIINITKGAMALLRKPPKVAPEVKKDPKSENKRLEYYAECWEKKKKPDKENIFKDHESERHGLLSPTKDGESTGTGFNTKEAIGEPEG